MEGIFACPSEGMTRGAAMGSATPLTTGISCDSIAEDGVDGEEDGEEVSEFGEFGEHACSCGSCEIRAGALREDHDKCL